MSMTKKDFTALAQALHGKRIPVDVYLAIVDFCLCQNPNFNAGRFNLAVGARAFGQTEAQVHADWLLDNGFESASQALRSAFK